MIKYFEVDENFSLEGKTAIITGGSAGIGYATAVFFNKKGVNLVLVDKDPGLSEIVKEFGPNCIGVTGDICDRSLYARVIDAGVKAFGKIDILINNAGVGFVDDAEKISEEYWNTTIDVNLSGNFFMAQAVGKYMIENGIDGSIVNLASQAGSIALDKHVAYTASKGGVIAMTKVLAKEWGRYGIRVNSISPTVTLTDMGHKTWDGPVGDAFKKLMPAGRFAETDEIAGCIAFLCSRAAGMITGHDLVVDGGFTIQ